MFTSSYFQFKGAGRVGISRGTPRGIPAGFRKYLPLAPAADLLAEVTEYAEFRDRYRAQLDQLDPSRVIADLQRLAGDCAVPTLLCFCNLGKPGSWCHRTMCAEWLSEQAGITCVELSPGAVRKIKKAEQLALI